MMWRMLVQIPAVLTSIAAVSSLEHPDLCNGGLLWMPDLTAPAIQRSYVTQFVRDAYNDATSSELKYAAWSRLVAPMGISGCMLPIIVYYLLLSNIVHAVEGGMRSLLSTISRTEVVGHLVRRSLVRSDCIASSSSRSILQARIPHPSLPWPMSGRLAYEHTFLVLGDACQV